MKVIARPRQGGKTTETIKLAAEQFAYIVCTDFKEAQRIYQEARGQGISIPFPLTWDEFARGEFHGRGIRGFVFDDLDRMLSGAARGVPVLAVSLTDEEAPLPA